MEKIKNAKGKHFPEVQILDWFVQMCLAIMHCHGLKTLHRDLKSQNVFLTSKNFVKLGDFGIAKVLAHTVDKATTVVGTPYYLSPEIIQGKPYSFASDIWSLGVILYEMCALKPPFNAGSLAGLGMKIISDPVPPIPSQYSPELGKLLSHLLEKSPAKRPNIKEVLSKQYLISSYRNSPTFRENQKIHPSSSI